MENHAALLTEAPNPQTANIDMLPTLEILQRINAEDARVAPAVAAELPQIAAAVDAIVERLGRGGRLVYVGAGTSGRLAQLDAAEMPPTFNTPPDLVVALLAGGTSAAGVAQEAAEDDAEQGRRDIADSRVTALDCVLGVAASGRTPYVLGALDEARARGALTISLACNRPAPIQEHADINIAAVVGPEVIAGSTRLKAGTAQKMVLNMLSTTIMIELGKTFGNLMVDVQATNDKLRARARRIVETVCGLSPEAAQSLLESCDGEVKTALVAALAGVSPELARHRLASTDGSVRAALVTP